MVVFIGLEYQQILLQFATIDAVENVIAPNIEKSVKEMKIVITSEQGIMGTSLGELQEEELKKMGAKTNQNSL